MHQGLHELQLIRARASGLTIIAADPKFETPMSAFADVCDVDHVISVFSELTRVSVRLNRTGRFAFNALRELNRLAG